MDSIPMSLGCSPPPEPKKHASYSDRKPLEGIAARRKFVILLARKPVVLGKLHFYSNAVSYMFLMCYYPTDPPLDAPSSTFCVFFALYHTGLTGKLQSTPLPGGNACPGSLY